MGDRDREFFKPLWRRIAVLVVLLAWLAWEWSNGDSYWGVIVAGAIVYFVWAYLITFTAAPSPVDAVEKSDE